MKNILGLKTYGKIPFYKKIILEFRDRFKPNKFTENMLNENGIGVYVPKLNRTRLTIGIILATICIVLPIITPLSVPVMLWSIR